MRRSWECLVKTFGVWVIPRRGFRGAEAPPSPPAPIPAGKIGIGAAADPFRIPRIAIFPGGAFPAPPGSAEGPGERFWESPGGKRDEADPGDFPAGKASPGAGGKTPGAGQDFPAGENALVPGGFGAWGSPQPQIQTPIRFLGVFPAGLDSVGSGNLFPSEDFGDF